jgi:hypothetical protein
VFSNEIRDLVKSISDDNKSIVSKLKANNEQDVDEYKLLYDQVGAVRKKVDKIRHDNKDQ